MMMDRVFNTVLELSIFSSLVILIVMLIRYLVKNKFTKTFSYAIWLIVLIRLMVPIHLESQLSIFNFLPFSPALVNVDEVNHPSSEVSLKDASVVPSEGLKEKTDISQNSDYMKPIDPLSVKAITGLKRNPIDFSRLLQIISYLWIVIALLMSIWFIYIYLSMSRKLKDAVMMHQDFTKRRIYISSKIHSPILVGLIKPRIILPKELDLSEEMLQHIIEHELVHIKRFDYLIKPIALAILCIHWFNPLVWFSYFLAMKDMELACDEAVLSKHGFNHQSDYAKTLLKMSMKHQHFKGGMVAFGEKNIKTRIKAVINFKRAPRLAKILGMAALLLLAVVLISNGNEKNKIIRLLEAQYPYEIHEEDIIQIIERKDETLVFHKGYNNEGKYPVCVLSYIEKSGFNWSYRGSYQDTQNLEQIEAYYSTIAVVGAGDEEHRLVTGIIKGAQISKVNVYNRFAEISDIQASTKIIDEELTLWYKIVDAGLPADYEVEFLDANGKLLHHVGQEMMDDPLAVIQTVRGYEVPKENVIDLVESELGLLVFYDRTIGGGSTVYCYELLEKTSTGYQWVTGGQHSDGRLDEGDAGMSTVQYMREISEKAGPGLIYGVTRSKSDKIDITTSMAASTWPYQPETVTFGENLLLWYCILPYEFGEHYEVVFSSQDDILFVEGTDYGIRNDDKEITYDDVRELDQVYGFNSGLILSVNQANAQILLYNNEKDVLNALLITIDLKKNVQKEEPILLNEKLKGYSFYAKYGDFRDQKYILADRSKIDEVNNKIYSDLVCIPKNNLEDLMILNSYEQDLGAQGTIPTIIDFSVELVGDYITYEDVDLYWKVQKIATKEIYTSTENEAFFNIIEPVSGEGKADETYIYILKYLEDGSVLAFEKETGEFVHLEQ